MGKKNVATVYDPTKVVQTVAGYTIHGHKDDLVAISRNEKTVEMTVGVDGEIEISRTANFSGKAEISLQQGSVANDYLSTYMNAIEAGTPVVVPYTMQDLSGTTIVDCALAILEGMPNIEQKAKPGERKWTLLLGNFDWFIGAGKAAEKYKP